MLKALLKKQLWELASSLTHSTGGGRRGMAALAALVLACVFGACGSLFYQMADLLCLPLVQQGRGWLYFALTGTMATALGAAGSMFAAHAALYQARDNELLLAMPIPPSRLLLVRAAGVYLLSFALEAAALIPAMGVYWNRVRPGAAAAAFQVLLLFLLPLLAAALACALGGLIGLVLAHTRKNVQNFVQVALTLGFAAAYYYGYTHVYGALQRVLTDGAALGGRMRVALYPMYWMGRAAEGSAASMALFAACTGLAASAVYALLARSFLRLATRRPGAARAVYKEKAVRPGTPRQALLRKEWGRFLGTPVYLLNCGLGTLLLAACTVLAAARGGQLRAMLDALPGEGQALAPLLVCAAAALPAAMNLITAPSISLESRCLWLLQSLPVDPWQVLRQKLALHVQVTAVPAAVCTLTLAYVLRLRWYAAALALVCVTLYVVLCAAAGLCVNLRLPNLNWTNETAAVKRSVGVLAAMLLNGAAALALGALYLAAGRALTAEGDLLVCAALLAAADAAGLGWLRRRGADLLAGL